MPWITPVVSWLANHIPTKDDFNRIEGNILYLNDNKVEKIDGKSLSTNDYTTTEKNKLAGIEAGARKSMPASEILTALKTVDGAGSGLDADTLDGNDSSSFAATNHSHNGYAPTSHASSGSTYGLGTTANYGHVKTINGLTQASYVDGLTLSAYQGKVLKDLVDLANPPKVYYSGNATIGSQLTVCTFDITKHKGVILSATYNARIDILSNNKIHNMHQGVGSGGVYMRLLTLTSTLQDVTNRPTYSAKGTVFLMKVVGNIATLVIEVVNDTSTYLSYEVMLF